MFSIDHVWLCWNEGIASWGLISCIFVITSSSKSWALPFLSLQFGWLNCQILNMTGLLCYIKYWGHSKDFIERPLYIFLDMVYCLSIWVDFYIYILKNCTSYFAIVVIEFACLYLCNNDFAFCIIIITYILLYWIIIWWSTSHTYWNVKILR